jgi:superfamily II DNA helicase RecQ
MAKKAGISISDCLKQLKYLNTENYIIYQKKYQGGRITYLQPIIDKNHLNFDFDRIRKQKEAFTIRMENMIQYAFSKGKCLSKLILSYFSEDLLDDCGHCAYCIQIKKNNIEEVNPTLISEKIVIDFIRENQITYKILVDTFSRTNDLREQTIKIIRHLMDENVVYIDVNNYLRVG